MPQRLRSAEKTLASIQEAAAYAHVHTDTIRRRISSGQLTGYRFGKRLIRVDLGEVDALLRPIPTAQGRDVA